MTFELFANGRFLGNPVFTYMYVMSDAAIDKRAGDLRFPMERPNPSSFKATHVA